jgi:uncharacterized membrane protein
MDYFFLQNLPPELATFFIAASPILELRGAIPIALTIFKLSPVLTYFIAVLGNVFSMLLALILLEPLSKFLMKHSKFFNKFFLHLFEKTRKKHNHRFEKWGALALISFVAIPLPFTGGWTGAVAAFVFGVPFRRAAFLISFGIMIAGLLVTGASLGVIRTII